MSMRTDSQHMGVHNSLLAFGRFEPMVVVGWDLGLAKKIQSVMSQPPLSNIKKKKIKETKKFILQGEFVVLGAYAWCLPPVTAFPNIFSLSIIKNFFYVFFVCDGLPDFEDERSRRDEEIERLKRLSENWSPQLVIRR